TRVRGTKDIGSKQSRAHRHVQGWFLDRSDHGQEACTTASVESRRSIDGSRPTLVRSARRTDTHAAHRGGKGGDR
ncbi:hypothetical protein EV363DRAFT_1273262, partial [Boletus edulis]